MLHRILKGWKCSEGTSHFSGPVEVDETRFVAMRKNMSNTKRKEADRYQTRASWQDCRGERQGPRCQPSRCNGGAIHGIRDIARIRQGSGGKGSDGLHGRSRGVRLTTVRARGGRALGERVVERHGSHERSGVVLGDAETRHRGHVRQDRSEASESLGAGLHGKVQVPRFRRTGPDDSCDCGAGREAAAVQRSDCG